MSHLVVGAGQIGVAVAEVLGCDSRDIAPHDGVYDTLHICFPWSESFVDDVIRYQELHQASHVVVHSTVPVGTCDPHGWTHSPVRGRHPNLAEGVRVFVKHFGGPDAEAAAAPFEAAGVVCEIHDRAATTEAGKLFELAQFGIQVAMNKRIHEWCEAHRLPFDEVYTTFGNTYNEGYRALDEDRFVKPVLKYVPGGIGGHCVMQNSPMLGEAWIDDFLAPYGGGGPAGGTV